MGGKIAVCYSEKNGEGKCGTMPGIFQPGYFLPARMKGKPAP